MRVLKVESLIRRVKCYNKFRIDGWRLKQKKEEYDYWTQTQFFDNISHFD